MEKLTIFFICLIFWINAVVFGPIIWWTFINPYEYDFPKNVEDFPENIDNSRVEMKKRSLDNYDSYLIPESYSLLIKPKIENFLSNFDIFTGQVNITIYVIKSTQNVELKADNLQIKSIKLIHSKSNSSIAPTTFFMRNELLTIVFQDPLEKGDAVLNIEYQGTIEVESNVKKFTLTNQNNESNWWIMGYNESPLSNAIFPFWNNPDIKVHISVVIEHDKNYRAFSNMHVVKTEELNHKIKTYFAESPYMLISDLMFIVTPRLSCRKNNEAHINICANSGLSNIVDHTLEIASTAIEIMENIFGIANTNKFDIVILNLNQDVVLKHGLATNLLIGRKMTQENFKKSKLLVGNILATYINANSRDKQFWTVKNAIFQYFVSLISNQIVFNRQTWDDSLVDSMYNSMINDGILLSLLSDENHPSYHITETKFANLMRMFSHIIGSETLRKKLTNYILDSSSNPDNVTNFINKFKGIAHPKNLKMKEIMSNWLREKGYPVLKVTRNYITGEVTLMQTKNSVPIDNVPVNSINIVGNYFYNTNIKKTGRYDSSKFFVPINYAIENTHDFDNVAITHWLKPTDESIKFQIQPNNWIILNKQSTNYYAVNYDGENWNMIIKTLNSLNYNKIHVYNRAQLIRDAYIFYTRKELTSNVLFSLLRYLERETDPLPWQYAIYTFENLRQSIPCYKKCLTSFLDFINNTAVPISRQINFNIDETNNNNMDQYKEIFLPFFCRIQVPSCVNEAEKIFTEWLKDMQAPPHVSDILSKTILCVGGRNLNETKWNELYEIWRETNNKHIRDCLICGSNPERVADFLHEFSNKSTYDDVTSVVLNFPRDNISTNVIFIFLLEQWQEYISKASTIAINYKQFILMLKNILPQLTELKLQMLHQFLDDNRDDLSQNNDERDEIIKLALYCKHRIFWHYDNENFTFI